MRGSGSAAFMPVPKLVCCNLTRLNQCGLPWSWRRSGCKHDKVHHKLFSNRSCGSFWIQFVLARRSLRLCGSCQWCGHAREYAGVLAVAARTSLHPLWLTPQACRGSWHLLERLHNAPGEACMTCLKEAPGCKSSVNSVMMQVQSR